MAGAGIPDGLVLCKIEEWDHITAQVDYGGGIHNDPGLA